MNEATSRETAGLAYRFEIVSLLVSVNRRFFKFGKVCRTSNARKLRSAMSCTDVDESS
jgi:hypothetical protein